MYKFVVCVLKSWSRTTHKAIKNVTKKRLGHESKKESLNKKDIIK